MPRDTQRQAPTTWARAHLPVRHKRVFKLLVVEFLELDEETDKLAVNVRVVDRSRRAEGKARVHGGGGRRVRCGQNLTELNDSIMTRGCHVHHGEVHFLHLLAHSLGQ